MPCVVPQSNHGTGARVLVGELAQARRPQEEASSGPGREAEPARRQDPQEMPAREEQDVAVDGTHPVDHAVGPHGDLVRRFTVGTAVAKQVSLRPLAMDVGAGPSFVAAVVPFEEIGIAFGARAEAGKLTGLGRTLQRAGEHLRECHALEPLGQPTGVLLATRGQRQIRQSRVLAGEAPGRFAVAREVYRRKRFAHAATDWPCALWLATIIGDSAVRFAFTARRIAWNARGCLDIPLEISSKSSGKPVERSWEGLRT